MGAPLSGCQNAETYAFITVWGADAIHTGLRVTVTIGGQTRVINLCTDVTRATTAIDIEHADSVEIIGAEVLAIVVRTLTDLTSLLVSDKTIGALQITTFQTGTRRHTGLLRDDGDLATFRQAVVIVCDPVGSADGVEHVGAFTGYLTTANATAATLVKEELLTRSTGKIQALADLFIPAIPIDVGIVRIRALQLASTASPLTHHPRRAELVGATGVTATRYTEVVRTLIIAIRAGVSAIVYDPAEVLRTRLITSDLDPGASREAGIIVCDPIQTTDRG